MSPAVSRREPGSTSASFSSSCSSSPSSPLGTMDARASGEGNDGVAAKLLFGGAIDSGMADAEVDVVRSAEADELEAMGDGVGEWIDVWETSCSSDWSALGDPVSCL